LSHVPSPKENVFPFLFFFFWMGGQVQEFVHRTLQLLGKGSTTQAMPLTREAWILTNSLHSTAHLSPSPLNVKKNCSTFFFHWLQLFL
jgi:hypothetical protein